MDGTRERERSLRSFKTDWSIVESFRVQRVDGGGELLRKKKEREGRTDKEMKKRKENEKTKMKKGQI